MINGLLKPDMVLIGEVFESEMARQRKRQRERERPRGDETERPREGGVREGWSEPETEIKRGRVSRADDI